MKRRSGSFHFLALKLPSRNTVMLISAPSQTPTHLHALPSDQEKVHAYLRHQCKNGIYFTRHAH